MLPAIPKRGGRVEKRASAAAIAGVWAEEVRAATESPHLRRRGHQRSSIQRVPRRRNGLEKGGVGQLLLVERTRREDRKANAQKHFLVVERQGQKQIGGHIDLSTP